MSKLTVHSSCLGASPMLAESLVLSAGKSPLGLRVTLVCCVLKGMGQHTPFRVWFWGCHITPTSPFLVPICTGFSSIPTVPWVIPAFHRSASLTQRPAWGLQASLWSHMLCALAGSSTQCHRTGRAAVTCTYTPVTAETMTLLLIYVLSQSSYDLPCAVKHSLPIAYSFPVLTEMCIRTLRPLIFSVPVYKIHLWIYPVHSVCVCHLYILCVS